jgi:hypothetical protein
MHLSLRLLVGAASWLCLAAGVHAAVAIDPYYAGSYSLLDLGSAPGVPLNYGGLSVDPGDTDTLLLGGAANKPEARIYRVPLGRDGSGRIVGFDGGATAFANANGVTGGIDGGLMYGPGGVLFYTSFADNHIGQIKPGSAGPDKLVDLGGLGVADSVGALAFVPEGMPGAGRLKIASTTTSRWYDATVTADASGTCDIDVNSGIAITIGGAPQGILYVPLGSALFPDPSILVAEFGLGRISSYAVDGNGDPVLSTRRTFISGLTNPEGATIDPITGDFLFSTFGGESRIVHVSAVPEPGTWVLLGVGLVMLAVAHLRTPRARNAGRGSAPCFAPSP